MKSKSCPSIVCAAILVAAACNVTASTSGQISGGGLQARPDAQATTVAAGTYDLHVVAVKDARLMVPPSSGASALPLVVMLHGAGGTPAAVAQIMALGQQQGFAVLAPQSREATWDLSRGGFGPDVEVIDDALAETFARVRVDPTRIAIAGFSDGASYALNAGRVNGDLFTHVIAFSPGYLVSVDRHGTPAFYIAHGRSDAILPFENAERNIVPALEAEGYDVDFVPFDGPHTVDYTEALRAFDWFLDR